jgi:hypothetical protein
VPMPGRLHPLDTQSVRTKDRPNTIRCHARKGTFMATFRTEGAPPSVWSGAPPCKLHRFRDVGDG